MATTPTHGDAVRRELERVLKSTGFSRNERMSRFLRFLTERRLEGSDDQLKESVLAVEVFGRKPDHDPSQDSIVRTEAGRLRARLAEYYVGEGKDDEVVIELPKGGYTPVFRVREAAHLERRPRARRWVWALTAAAALALTLAVWASMKRAEGVWRNPIAEARFQSVTDFDGTEQEAAVSRDGKFIAFLSRRDGPTDLWVTPTGSGEFRNLTKGSVPELGNPQIRALDFSPDGSLVTYWLREAAASNERIDVWGMPVLGGQPRRYLEGVAEFDWSSDGSRLVYHTPERGDPVFVSDGLPDGHERLVFAGPTGLHSHFPLWAPDERFVYFVHGAIPDKMDIWRVSPKGGTAERVTSQNGRVSHPVLLSDRTLLYLASDSDGSGPWLYGMDVDARVPHRLTFGTERYTSLAGTADGRRLVMTRASPKRTLWQMDVTSGKGTAPPVRIPVTPGAAFAPRLGTGYMLYGSSAGGNQSIWKHANGADTELWNAAGAQWIGGPAISRDGGSIAFSMRQGAWSLLYAMKVDGTAVRMVADSLDLQGSPAWAPDGASITVAANERGAPRLFRVRVNGGAPAVVASDYAMDPAWDPGGRFLVYSGPDVGTAFSVKAVTPAGASYPFPGLANLTRGARRLKFVQGGRKLAFLRGGIEHKDLWVVDLTTGAEQRVTELPGDFDIQDFDISEDGKSVVVERVQERSDVVMVDLTGR